MPTATNQRREPEARIARVATGSPTTLLTLIFSAMKARRDHRPPDQPTLEGENAIWAHASHLRTLQAPLVAEGLQGFEERCCQLAKSRYSSFPL
jgi:hypothetical protein